MLQLQHWFKTQPYQAETHSDMMGGCIGRARVVVGSCGQEVGGVQDLRSGWCLKTKYLGVPFIFDHHQKL
jgi:hypothetical protein